MRTHWRCRAVALVMLALAAGYLGAEEQGGRARNKRLFIVPPPGPVKIDGRLDDWDLSGQIEIVVTRETAATQSARIAAMYDAEAFYLSGDFRDPSPMMNKHDPRVNAEKAWDADAFQFRLVLDPKLGFPIHEGSLDNPKPNPAICHMLLWYYTDRKEPCLHLQYGMTYSLPKAGYPQGVVPQDKFQAACRLADDGKGYTFEYRIPWTTLEATSPLKAGDAVASSIQIQWGTPDGLSSGGGGWAMDLMATGGFPFQSTAWTKAEPVRMVRMDVGYLFGNSTGNRCAQRAYWSNNSPTANIIDDIPSESRLEPDKWGNALLE